MPYPESNPLMTRLSLFKVLFLFLVSANALAQTKVELRLDAKEPGIVVPEDFAGLSFEMERLLPDEKGNYYFSANNQSLLTLFKTLGLKSLRVGGNTADRPTVKVPGEPEIDSLFAFARAARAKVIYTLRLRKGDMGQAVKIAQYIMRFHQAELLCFAIGNEPNVFAKEYPVYRQEWKNYMETITAPDIAPGAKFCGPSATPGKTSWARDFVSDFGSSGRLAFISQHDYPGGGGNKVTDPVTARDKMLSPAWLEKYQSFYDSFAKTAASNGLPFRLEEANNFFNGGAKDVSDTFAAALWALDYLHWWAARGAGGINFHTGDFVAAGEKNTPCRYAAFWSTEKGYAVHPLGYGMKAFELGGHGRTVPLTVANPGELNFTAYALSENSEGLNITVLNKEHGPNARSASLVLRTGGAFSQAKMQALVSPGNEVAATSGTTLGGVLIQENGTWDGKWSPLNLSSGGAQLELTVPPATAMIIRLK